MFKNILLNIVLCIIIPCFFSSCIMAAGYSSHNLKVLFLGTGAADWTKPSNTGEERRFSSVLIDDKILIDYTSRNKEILPEGLLPQVIFYTHSHKDHYDPYSMLDLGIECVYVSDTWYDIANKEFGDAAISLKKNKPRIVPILVGQQVKIGDLVFTALPANHSTDNVQEQCLNYLIEKNGIRIIYATDTSGINTKAAQIAGIDYHKKGKPITGLIMEATMGHGHYEDYRIFQHSSVEDVSRLVNVLLKTKRYIPCDSQYVYITHLAKTLHGSQIEINEKLPMNIKAAYDGLQVFFKLL